ncbi:Acyl dehydratase [Pedobacter steynii]|uniref:Acyl dehydratase n=1 Tax=Pedobacter steynii TaxID=430522 RepID=A0A1G9WGD8_9SPHI|nr:MaoC/PaaZ C-terminal domain-containing protein [Pedobacter steynii]NQX40289.1 dehydratase [Pedobacter steynii]SDM83540.1 Acyl dehydratase [Pedobacter steynii]
MNEFVFSDIHIGLEQSFEATVSADKLDKFLEISGDNNPLHINSEYARHKNFPDRVVYGLLTSTFYSTLVGVYLPGKYAILHSIDIKFLKPVFINDQLKIVGIVSYINEAYKQIEVKAYISNQAGVKVSKANIKIGLIDE